MSPGAELFVVCKQCGAEVSSYVTECPYCGNRIRKRAPKLPRANVGATRRAGAAGPGRRAGRFSKLSPSGPKLALGGREHRWTGGFAHAERPYAALGIVLVSAVLWVLLRSGALGLGEVLVVGNLHGEWWRLLSSQFAYGSGLGAYVYGFATLSAVAVFGGLLERRHGLAVVLALFVGAGVSGALLALSLYGGSVLVEGANAGALALVGAWAVPDLIAVSRKRHYEGDLLGTAAFAGALLVLPFANPDASWIAGLTGALFGLLVGMGLVRVRAHA